MYTRTYETAIFSISITYRSGSHLLVPADNVRRLSYRRHLRQRARYLIPFKTRPGAHHVPRHSTRSHRNDKSSAQRRLKISLILSSATRPFHAEAKAAKLIIYNLGYLPRGDKTITTKVDTTIASLKSALPLIKPGGAVSVTCYPGHPEGAIEEKEIRLWSKQLPPEIWNICFHRFPNRKQSPSLFLLQK